MNRSPIRAVPTDRDSDRAAVQIGGSRVLAVTSDRDTALQMLESTSDLIPADSVRRVVVSAACPMARRSACYGVSFSAAPRVNISPRHGRALRPL
jgi:hypothetical protein